MKTYNIIINKLTEALLPIEIAVVDESHQHAGHQGAREGGQTHYAISVKSAKFNGLSRVQRHKLVYSILDNEMKGGIHALRIAATAEQEN